jgi:hypothetical protein
MMTRLSTEVLQSICWFGGRPENIFLVIYAIYKQSLEAEKACPGNNLKIVLYYGIILLAIEDIADMKQTDTTR